MDRKKFIEICNQKVKLIRAEHSVSQEKMANMLQTFQNSQKIFFQNASHELKAPLMSIIGFAEGILEFGGTLRGPLGEVNAALQGIARDARLSRLYDESGHQVFVEETGIVLSSHIAKQIGSGTGDYVELVIEYPQRRVSRMPVTAVAAQYMGSTAYMSHEAAGKVSDFGGAVTTLLIKGDQGASAAIAASLVDAPLVGTVSSRQEKLDMFRDLMGSTGAIMGTYAFLGVVISLAVFYVTSLISFEELKKEVAVMLTLGLRSKQCLEVVSVEQWILTVFGVLIGIPMTSWASGVISDTISTEMFSIPRIVDGASLALAIGMTCVTVWISSQMTHRKMKRITPVELLRERE